MIKWEPLKIIDKYIIKRLIGTYLFFIVSIITIVIMFDFNEKLDKFIQNSTPIFSIIFDYYFNFIPYFASLFSPLFVFISVIFLTSKLASHSEIIALLSSGISFNRFMLPYVVSAGLIAFFNFLLNGYVVPLANIKRIQFHNSYIRDDQVRYSENIQLAITPQVIVYFEHFNANENTGYHFSMEKFNGKKLCSRMTAKQIIWNTGRQWTVKNYTIFDYTRLVKKTTVGKTLDTMLDIHPSDFMISTNDCEQMNIPDFKSYINKWKQRGMIGNIKPFEIEYYKIYSMSFVTFILTIIGVTLSIQRRNGGTGINIIFGLFLSFSYILFIQISSSFAILGSVSPFVAVWIPNFVYLFIAIFLYKKIRL